MFAGMFAGKGKASEKQLKAGTKYNKSFKKMRWQGAKNMFTKFQGVVSLFGVLGEFIKPFMDLMDVFDAALVKEYQDEIEAVNKACQEGIPIMRAAAKATRSFLPGGPTVAFGETSSWFRGRNRLDEIDPWGGQCR
jgi:hypothetical protein